MAVAIIPSTGRRIMGTPGEKPEFSNFSWFSMMFGAGLGVGLMVFATAEPLGLWGSNPCSNRFVTGLLRLYPQYAAHNPLCSDASFRQIDERSTWSFG